MFSRAAKMLLEGQENCIAFIDDLLIFTKDFDTHLTVLAQVLGRLRAANLRCQPNKAVLCKRECKYLGFLLTKQGHLPDPDRAKAFLESKPPTNLRQLRGFLGVVNFYRRHLPLFSKKSKCLTALLKKGSKFEWSDECQRAFEFFRNSLVNAPILRSPNFDLEFRIYCDGSTQGLGSLIVQDFPNEGELPIMFLSRGLLPAETRYTTTELELCCLVFTIKKAEFYLTRPFKVFTDHAPLRTLLKIKTSASSRITRWAAYLSAWTFTVEYLPGTKNVIADYLSRLPNYESNNTDSHKPQLLDWNKELEEIKRIIERGKPVEIYTNQAPNLAILPEAQYEPVLDREHILEKQKNDEFAKKIELRLRQNPEVASEFFLDTDGLLYKQKATSEEEDKLVLPKSLRKRILDIYHDNPVSGGHGGVARTHFRISQRLYWPGMYKDIEQYCKACLVCNQVKPDLHKKRAPLKHMLRPKYAGQVGAIDVCGPFGISQNLNKYVLSYQDMYSRYIIFVPMKDCKGETVGRTYCQSILPHFGAAETIISDNGSAFVSEVFRSIAKMLNMSIMYTLAYRPMQNARLERQHGVLGKILSSYVNLQNDDWDEYLPYAAMLSNSAINATTGFTPSFLHFARNLYLPFDLLLKPRRIDYSLGENYVAELLARLQITMEKVKQNQETAMKASKLQFDKKASTQTLKLGDVVYMRNYALKPGVTRKFQKRFLGPYYVTKKIGDATYEIKQIYGRKVEKVHFDRLRKALKPGAPFEFDYGDKQQEKKHRTYRKGRSCRSESDSDSDGELLPDNLNNLPFLHVNPMPENTQISDNRDEERENESGVEPENEPQLSISRTDQENETAGGPRECRSVDSPSSPQPSGTETEPCHTMDTEKEIDGQHRYNLRPRNNIRYSK